MRPILELQFSPCGNYLHFLSLAFVSDELAETTTVRVAVSTFVFNNEADSEEMLLREGEVRRCTYSFGQSLRNVAKPLALTQWSDAYIIIALPPLTCDPKVLRISLPRGPEPDLDQESSEQLIRTLSSPIYFPTSTPHRYPRLMHRVEEAAGNSGEASYIYLALDTAEEPVKQRLVCQPEQGCEQQSIPTDESPFSQMKQRGEPSRACPPVVLRWKIPHPEGWRTWVTDEDSRAWDMKRGVSEWQMLRGNFVDSTKSFSVPIRSGLDWTRKGFLSCV